MLIKYINYLKYKNDNKKISSNKHFKQHTLSQHKYYSWSKYIQYYFSKMTTNKKIMTNPTHYKTENGNELWNNLFIYVS